MSTRVFKPISLEVSRIRSPISDNKSQQKGITKVRRVLFGPVDPEESKKLFEKEFALQNFQDTRNWEFDFVNEIPCYPGGISKRYSWTPVTPQHTNNIICPIKRKQSMDIEDNSYCYAIPSENVLRPLPIRPNDIRIIPDMSIGHGIKKQSRITGNLFIQFLTIINIISVLK